MTMHNNAKYIRTSWNKCSKCTEYCQFYCLFVGDIPLRTWEHLLFKLHVLYYSISERESLQCVIQEEEQDNHQVVAKQSWEGFIPCLYACCVHRIQISLSLLLQGCDGNIYFDIIMKLKADFWLSKIHLVNILTNQGWCESSWKHRVEWWMLPQWKCFHFIILLFCQY